MQVYHLWEMVENLQRITTAFHLCNGSAAISTLM